MKETILALTLLMALAFSGFGQSNLPDKDSISNKPANILQGLRKASPAELDPSKPIMLDGISIPVYLESMEPVSGESLMQTMMSGDFMPEPYVDDTKEIKLFILRKLSAEEKKMLSEMRPPMPNDQASPQNKGSHLKGKKGSAFEVEDINGRKYTLKDLSDKVVVMNFWFVECKPCVMEIPELNRLVDKYKDSNVIFLAFAENDKKAIESFLKNVKFDYNIVPNGRKIATDYSVEGYPTHVILDNRQIIQLYQSGFGQNTISDIEETIDLLLDGKKKK